MARILIIFAHPALHKSQANSRLLAAVSHLPNVTIRDIYQIYPSGYIDVLAEQALLREHDILVFQHPFYWYSCPALLKEWIDLVLTRGYAYAADPELKLPLTACLSVITTGGSIGSYRDGGYNQYPIRDFLLPFEQTARLCDMEYLPPFILDSVNKNADFSRFEQVATRYREVIIQLRDETFDFSAIRQLSYLHPVGP
ncbi:NAD(P)H-dependent oxidoreductase [Celerinatantimonas sp. YJH-8]|uniref:NAD(P)H-dependent oxidoreductase n=1 Tax=Celerinatantimonas sp. YJH-8 TaxID=3228714 RepID=UPI0038BFB596